MSKPIYTTLKSYINYIKSHPKYTNLNFVPDGRIYYVYRISHIISQIHYYGNRITKINPHSDLGIKYFSSSSDNNFITEQYEFPINFKYKIIRTFDNIGDSTIFESYLHQLFNVKDHPYFYNKSNAYPLGYAHIGKDQQRIKALNAMGEKNWKFKGYYTFRGLKFATHKEMSLGLNIKFSTVKVWCKNMDRIIDNKLYTKSR